MLVMNSLRGTAEEVGDVSSEEGEGEELEGIGQERRRRKLDWEGKRRDREGEELSGGF